jgi:hypothetical protein
VITNSIIGLSTYDQSPITYYMKLLTQGLILISAVAHYFLAKRFHSFAFSITAV